jgi:hypothetical protein
VTVWHLRKAMNLCARSGCAHEPVDGSNYCEPHWEDHRQRQKVCARARRYAKARQLTMEVVL